MDEEDEEDDEEDDEGALPLYRPHGQFAERVVIVGAGPGGLSAAVYAARAGLAPVVIAPSDGGQLLGKGVTVENYPGVVGDTGADPASGEAPSRYASRRRRSRVCPSPPRHRRGALHRRFAQDRASSTRCRRTRRTAARPSTRTRSLP